MPLLREGNFSQCYDPKMYPVKSILVFAKTVPKYPIKDLEKCIAAYGKSSNAVQINKFNYLSVFAIKHENEEQV